MLITIAIVGGVVTILVLLAMFVLVPRRTERVRQAPGDAPADTQGAELSAEDPVAPAPAR